MPRQLRRIRRLPADLGYADEAIRKAGFDPDDLRMEQASELITCLKAAKVK